MCRLPRATRGVREPRSVGGGAVGFGLALAADDGPFARRLRPAGPANGVVQMRRPVAQRSLNGKPVDGRAEHRFPEVTLETVLEQVGSAVAARGDGGLAEHDGDQAPAVARGRRHDVEARITDEAGLHAVGARERNQQSVVRAYDLVADLYGR